jgi:hypothetical protein
MAIGQATKATFKIIKEGLPNNPNLDFVLTQKEQCPFCINVFANALDESNIYENDFNSFIAGYSDVVTTASMELLKCGEVVATVTNNDYGQYYGFGFFNDGIKNYIGGRFDWFKVQALHGFGEYSVRINATTYSGDTVTQESLKYFVSQYTPAKAGGTVRFEFMHNGSIGDVSNPKSIRSFEGLKWRNQLRLRGIMHKAEPSYEIEDNTYHDGELIHIKNKMVLEFSAIIKPIPFEIHSYLQIDVLQADTILVSDYNYDSPLRPFLGRELIFNGGYEKNQIDRAKNSSAKITFIDKYQNYQKRFC